MTSSVPRGYPPTFVEVAGTGVRQHRVFDPSMKQHANAFRAGEPQFRDEGEGARWYPARREAAGAVLAAIESSGHADRLVLRGSFLLKMWFGKAAREPGDLDFVADSEDWLATEDRTEQVFGEIAQAAEAASVGTAVAIDAAGARGDEIWTYDRVPGRRLILPWSAEGCPDGSIQLDFVLGERIPDGATEAMTVAHHRGKPVTLRAANQDISLAWKILWLATDMYPQVKDLYDAVLLAESTSLRRELLEEVFDAVGETQSLRLIEEQIRGLDLENFYKDYPTLTEVDTGDLEQRFMARLGEVVESYRNAAG
jgi:hypothetical protein